VNKITNRIIIKQLWLHISPRRRKQMGLIFLLMLLSSVAEMVSMGAVLPFLGVIVSPEKVYEHSLVQPFVQVFNITDPQQLLLPFTVLFSVAALVSGALRLTLLWVQTRLSHAIGADLSVSIYKRTLYQPYAVHVMRNSSEVIDGIMSKASALVMHVIVPMLTIVSSMLIMISILFVLFSIDSVIAIAALTGFGAIYLIITFITHQSLLRHSKCISHEQPQLIKVIQEGLGGIRDVLIDGTQSIYCQIYRNSDLPLRRARANIQVIGQSPRYGIEPLGIILIAVLALVMTYRADGIVGAIPVLGTLALGAQKLLPILQTIYASWTSMQGDQASLRDALDLLDQPMPKYSLQASPDIVSFKHDIVLDNISFRYTSQAPWIFQDLNLRIHKGERIGFIGSTGCGKSTLLDIVMSLLQPIDGRLIIDNLPLGLKHQRAWQSHIAHVPQTIFLADATIAENIAFGVPKDEIDLDRVRDSAQKAQISVTIKSWDNQYDTKVGERGIRLSGGQRQRIGIARAFYKQADVIILDEATSALDCNTEQGVMQAIDSMGKDITVLIVAHRLSTLKSCDLVVELSEGQIVRSGTYHEIVEDKQD